MTARDPAKQSPEAIIQARAVRLAMGIAGPFYTMSRRMSAGFLAGVGAGFAAGLASGQPLVAAIVGATACLVVATIAWWPLFDPDFRGAAELFFDHDCHERAEWEDETGTPMPRGMRAAKQWLLANPRTPGRASLLLIVGRLDEADRAIEEMKASTPEEAFGVEILRQTRTIYAGGTPDLAPLHASWRALPNPRERRHRRECLAILNAAVAVDAGLDPIPSLAIGRQEIGEVHRTMRTPWLLAKWSATACLAVALATVLVAILSS